MTLRHLTFLTALYFAVLWMLLAEEYRYLGAGVLFAMGLVVGPRTLSGSPAAVESPALPSAPSFADAAPIPEDAIEPYEIESESPERQRARFFGALGHELRNPLNSVTGFSDMLLSGSEGELNAEQQRSVRTIRASAERLLRLVTTVVDQSRVAAGTLRLQQQWVAPSEVIAESMTFIRPRSEERSVSATVSDALPRVFVDRHRTVQALTALTVLAVRSSGTDVSIRAAPPRRDQVGRGFVQFDLMTHLTDASVDTLAIVERLENPSARTDALGLEVSVARSIIEAQGGRIWAEAGTAGSLRVCMTLPTFSAGV